MRNLSTTSEKSCVNREEAEMAGYETKAILMSILRYARKATNTKEVVSFVEDLLNADGYVPERKKQDESERNG